MSGDSLNPAVGRQASQADDRVTQAVVGSGAAPPAAAAPLPIGSQPAAVLVLDRPPDRQIRLLVTMDRETLVLRAYRRSVDAPAPDGFAAVGTGLVIPAADVAEFRALLELAGLELAHA